MILYYITYNATLLSYPPGPPPPPIPRDKKMNSFLVNFVKGRVVLGASEGSPGSGQPVPHANFKPVKPASPASPASPPNWTPTECNTNTLHH